MGSLRVLAVTTQQRLPYLPDVPTFAELGFPGYEISSWQGVFAPLGTPPAVIERIHAEINKIQATPDLQALMTSVNVEPPPIWTTEQFRALIARDLEVWKKIVHDARITLE